MAYKIHTSEKTGARVYRDAANNEWYVVAAGETKAHPSTYYTNDKADAIATAELFTESVQPKDTPVTPVDLLYALELKGKFLSTIFGQSPDGLEFNQTKVGESILYSDKEKALKMVRRNHGLTLVPVYQPKAPFGEYIPYIRQVKNVLALVASSEHYQPESRYCYRTQSHYMCDALQNAVDSGLICEKERHLCVESIQIYIYDQFCLKDILGRNNLPNGFDDRKAIYLDWENRPILANKY